jgi:hypothetical protein
MMSVDSWAAVYEVPVFYRSKRIRIVKAWAAFSLLGVRRDSEVKVS